MKIIHNIKHVSPDISQRDLRGSVMKLHKEKDNPRIQQLSFTSANSDVLKYFLKDQVTKKTTNYSAIKIQSQIKVHLFRKKIKIAILKKNLIYHNIILIQNHWRNYHTTKINVARFNALKLSSALTIQKYLKGRLVCVRYRKLKIGF